MSFKDTEQTCDFFQLLQTWDDQAAMVDFSIRRFKSHEGHPILKMSDLTELEPSPQESRFVRTSYDRFAFKLRPGPRPFFPI